jgi:hypothetical protein
LSLIRLTEHSARKNIHMKIEIFNGKRNAGNVNGSPPENLPEKSGFYPHPRQHSNIHIITVLRSLKALRRKGYSIRCATRIPDTFICNNTCPPTSSPAAATSSGTYRKHFGTYQRLIGTYRKHFGTYRRLIGTYRKHFGTYRKTMLLINLSLTGGVMVASRLVPRRSQ